MSFKEHVVEIKTPHTVVQTEPVLELEEQPLAEVTCVTCGYRDIGTSRGHVLELAMAHHAETRKTAEHEGGEPR